MNVDDQVAPMEIPDDEAIDMHVSQTQLPDEMIMMENSMEIGKETLQSQILSTGDAARPPIAENQPQQDNNLKSSSHEENDQPQPVQQPKDVISDKIESNVKPQLEEEEEIQPPIEEEYEDIDLHISQTQYDPDYDITQSADKALAMTADIYKAMLMEDGDDDDSIFPAEDAGIQVSATSFGISSHAESNFSETSYQSISIIREKVPVIPPNNGDAEKPTADNNAMIPPAMNVQEEPLSVYDIASTVSPPKASPEVPNDPDAGRSAYTCKNNNKNNNFLISNIFQQDHKAETPTQLDTFYKPSPSPSKKPLSGNLAGENVIGVNLEIETEDNEDWIDAKVHARNDERSNIVATSFVDRVNKHAHQTLTSSATVAAPTLAHKSSSASTTMGSWQTVSKADFRSTNRLLLEQQPQTGEDEDFQRSVSVLETVAAQTGSSTAITKEQQQKDSITEDDKVLRLKQEFQRKLEELLQMKADLEKLTTDKKSSDQPESARVSEKEKVDVINLVDSNVEVQIGTMDCAEILMNMVAADKSVSNGHYQVETKQPDIFLQIDTISPTTATGSGVASTGSTRKYNTFWNMKQSPSVIAPVEVEFGDKLSGSHNKMRRKYATSSPHGTIPIATTGGGTASSSSKEMTKHLFALPGKDDDDDWMDDSCSSDSDISGKKVSIKQDAKNAKVNATTSSINNQNKNKSVIPDKIEVNKQTTKPMTTSESSIPVAVSPNKKTVKIIDHHEEEASRKQGVNIESIPVDIPAVFVNEGIPRIWSEAWAELEEYGWYWTKGKKLIDFYYIRPYAKAANPFVLGQDYFISTDDVIKFLKKFAIEKKKTKHVQQQPPPPPAVVPVPSTTLAVNPAMQPSTNSINKSNISTKKPGNKHANKRQSVLEDTDDDILNDDEVKTSQANSSAVTKAKGENIFLSSIIVWLP